MSDEKKKKPEQLPQGTVPARPSSLKLQGVDLPADMAVTQPGLAGPFAVARKTQSPPKVAPGPVFEDAAFDEPAPRSGPGVLWLLLALMALGAAGTVAFFLLRGA